MPITLLLLLAASLGAQADSTPEARIRALLATQQSDWNRGDVRAFMNGYEESDALTFVGATLTRGYRQVLENYIKRYPTRENMGKLTFSGIEVHMLGADHAWVLGRFALERTTQGGGNISGVFTLVLRRTAAGWKIVLDHTT